MTAVRVLAPHYPPDPAGGGGSKPPAQPQPPTRAQNVAAAAAGSAFGGGSSVGGFTPVSSPGGCSTAQGFGETSSSFAQLGDTASAADGVDGSGGDAPPAYYRWLDNHKRLNECDLDDCEHVWVDVGDGHFLSGVHSRTFDVRPRGLDHDEDVAETPTLHVRAAECSPTTRDARASVDVRWRMQRH